MNNVEKRIKWIDLVRAIAILLVILCHTTENIYEMKLESMTSLSLQSRIFCFASFTAGRLGVPLFLMITGSLLLPREYDNDSIKSFWKNRWVHLLICTVIWFTIYDLFLVLNNHAVISILQFFEEVFFLRKVNMTHVWYLPTILGLYISLPFVSSVLKKYDISVFLFPVLIYTIFSFGYSTFILIYRVYHPELPLSNQFSLGFSGGIYGLYIIYGYFVSAGVFRKISTKIILVILISALVSVIFIQNWSYQSGYEYNVWYDSLPLLIASIGVYQLVSRTKNNQINTQMYKLIKYVSTYSFGVYLTHNMIIECIGDSFKGFAVIMPFKVILLWIICFIISLVITVLISKIPKLGKYTLYLK